MYQGNCKICINFYSVYLLQKEFYICKQFYFVDAKDFVVFILYNYTGDK